MKDIHVFIRISILSFFLFGVQVLTFWKLNMVLPKDKEMIMNKFNSLAGKLK